MSQKQDKSKIVKVVASGVPEIYPDVCIFSNTLEKIKDKHPEEFSRLDDIYATIERPCEIYKSKTHLTSVTLINRDCTSKSGDPLRVAIKIVEQSSQAIMTTAHFSSTSDQGQLLWSINNEN